MSGSYAPPGGARRRHRAREYRPRPHPCRHPVRRSVRRSPPPSTPPGRVGKAPGGADRSGDAERRARSNSSWCREGPRISLINGLCRTKESRAWPGHPILIPRGGPRPWEAYQRSTAKRCAIKRARRPRGSVSTVGMGQGSDKVGIRPRLSVDHGVAQRHATALAKPDARSRYRHVRAFCADRDFAGALAQEMTRLKALKNRTKTQKASPRAIRLTRLANEERPNPANAPPRKQTRARK